MRTRDAASRFGKLTAAVSVAALAMAALGMAAAPAAAGPHLGQYRATDLGIPGVAEAINDRGDVVGTGEFTPGLRHPFLWRNGELTDLGELRPTYGGDGAATDINNRGQVVGYSYVGTKNPPIGMAAFIWQDGVMTALDTPGTDSYANAINDRGQVVGTYYTDSGTHAFLWERGVLTDLGPGGAADINERGQIVGSRLLESDASIPVVWYRGREVELRQWPGTTSWTIGMNDRGWIIGASRIGEGAASSDHGYLWRSGHWTDLGRLGPGDTYPAGLNNRGQIVGRTRVSEIAAPIPFLWQNGRMIDLTGHGVSGEVRSIDERGRLVGSAEFPGGHRHASIYRL